jgi:hypothetical protein
VLPAEKMDVHAMPGRKGGYRFIGHQDLYMVTEDWREFFATLKQAFPAIRLVADSKWPDPRRAEAEALHQEFQRQGLAPVIDWSTLRGSPPKTPPIELGDRVSWKVWYADDTWQDSDDAHIRAWIEPPDWRPNWLMEPIYGTPYIGNSPDVSILIQRGCFGPKIPQDPWFTSSDPDKFERRISLDASSLYGGYYPHQQDKRRWLSQIRRMIVKQTTNVLTYVDLETLAVRFRAFKGSSDRAGRHAIDWVRAHPRHMFGRWIKAIDWELPPPPWNPGRE